MRERDVLIAACGVNADGSPKAQVMIETKFIDVEKGEEERVDSIHLHGPIVNCFRNIEHMNVDVQFNGSTDPAFIQCIQMLKSFCVPENSFDSESDKIPIVALTIVPDSLNGEFLVIGTNASWVVMPSQANRLPDMIRFIFNNNDFRSFRAMESYDVPHTSNDAFL